MTLPGSQVALPHSLLALFGLLYPTRSVRLAVEGDLTQSSKARWVLAGPVCACQSLLGQIGESYVPGLPGGRDRPSWAPYWSSLGICASHHNISAEVQGWTGEA